MRHTTIDRRPAGAITWGSGTGETITGDPGPIHPGPIDTGLPGFARNDSDGPGFGGNDVGRNGVGGNGVGGNGVGLNGVGGNGVGLNGVGDHAVGADGGESWRTLRHEPGRPSAARHSAPEPAQSELRLTDHLVPQRNPAEADVQLRLDIPAQTDRRTAADTVGAPDHRRIARHWLTALLETANGRRDRRQLDRLLTRGVHLRLGALAAAPRPRVVHTNSPAPGVIYLAATVRLPGRARALTATLRHQPGGSWRATAVDLL